MNASGKFVLRIPPSMHLRFKTEAKARNISLNQTILQRLEQSQEEPEVLSFIRKTFPESLLGVVLFGSSVRDERHAGSDIDLLIVLGESQPIERALYEIWDQKISPVVGDEYSPQFVHMPHFSEISGLWLEVAMEGEVTHDRDSKVKTTLRKIREEIAAGKYVRKLIHGHAYWTRRQEKP